MQLLCSITIFAGLAAARQEAALVDGNRSFHRVFQVAKNYMQPEDNYLAYERPAQNSGPLRITVQPSQVTAQPSSRLFDNSSPSSPAAYNRYSVPGYSSSSQPSSQSHSFGLSRTTSQPILSNEQQNEVNYHKILRNYQQNMVRGSYTGNAYGSNAATSGYTSNVFGSASGAVSNSSPQALTIGQASYSPFRISNGSSTSPQAGRLTGEPYSRSYYQTTLINR